MSQDGKKRKREVSPTATTTVTTRVFLTGISRNVSFQDQDEDDDPTRVIEHFNSYLHDNYQTSPVFFVGTLEQAVNRALHCDALEDVRLALSRS